MCIVCRHVDGIELIKKQDSGYYLIHNCERIANIPAEFTQIAYNLTIANCPNLVTIVPSPTVQYLAINSCPRLIRIPKFENLYFLDVSKCDRLISIAKMMLLGY